MFLRHRTVRLSVMASGKKTGGGSRKGVPNKSTALAREAIATFVDGNTHKLDAWLDAIAAKDGPKAAFQCLASVLEYHVPKLARSEITGEDGGAIDFNHQFSWMREALSKRKG